MLFPPVILRGIGDGTVTLAFRRWEAPRVRLGGRQRTAVGVIEFAEVEALERSDLTDADASAAGHATLADLLAFVDRRPTGTIYRIRLRIAGPDPRVALRDAVPDADQMRDIERRLARLDRASRHGSWTMAVLRAIGDQPGVRAADLATGFQRERLAFKLDVRKLKELGLTESLPRGYRLSPCGRAVLEDLDERDAPR